MNKIELLDWYSLIESEKMPTYIESTDANNSQLFIDGEWKNAFYSWTLLCVGGIWKYAETDSERGYVYDFKIFDSEEDAIEYAKNILQKKYSAIGENCTKEMLSRYIQQKFGYSEKRAKTMIEQLYDEIKNTNNDGTINWEPVLEVLFNEKEKDPNREFVSLKNAVKVYLGASNDYDNVYFTRICEVQEALEGYYDELLKGFITSNSTLPEKRVEKMIKNLKIHLDLYAEIVGYLLADNVYKSPLILEQGYDAKKLCSEFNLTIVGAYNFMIYLREEPDNALADLKAGLPRK